MLDGNSPSWPPRRTRLPSIDVPELQGVNLHPKKLPFHPLIPIIIGIASATWGSNLRMTLWIILGCSVWLCFDLWPWAQWAGIKISNRKASFVHQLGKEGKEEATAN